MGTQPKKYLLANRGEFDFLNNQGHNKLWYECRRVEELVIESTKAAFLQGDFSSLKNESEAPSREHDESTFFGAHYWLDEG